MVHLKMAPEIGIGDEPNLEIPTISIRSTWGVYQILKCLEGPNKQDRKNQFQFPILTHLKCLKVKLGCDTVKSLHSVPIWNDL